VGVVLIPHPQLIKKLNSIINIMKIIFKKYITKKYGNRIIEVLKTFNKIEDRFNILIDSINNLGINTKFVKDHNTYLDYKHGRICYSFNLDLKKSSYTIKLIHDLDVDGDKAIELSFTKDYDLDRIDVKYNNIERTLYDIDIDIDDIDDVLCDFITFFEKENGI